jgi:4-alpha-glucanotransferase
MGDLPIFISADSADVWVNPELFLLDRRGRPTAVAGAPPDFFSRTGQRWGNALYDWAAMKKRRFAWWADRVRITLQQVDLVRLDHFRGFAACWRIPARLPTAVGGRWCKGPGQDLFRSLQKQIGSLPFVAEDLGLITPDVKRLRDDLGLPGMRVLQFAFGEPDSEHLPHNHPRTCIAYTGTHDNDTTLGWYRSLNKADRRRVHAYLPGTDADPAGALLRLTWSSVADIAIAPLQDVLGLGSEARMNFPGKSCGNWEWRFQRRLLTPGILDRLGQLTETYGRARKA